MSVATFGAIVTADDVSRAIRDTIASWIPTYIAELERQHQVEAASYGRPLAVVTYAEVETMPEDHLPAIVVQTASTSQEPMQHGDGSYSAWWQSRIGVFAEGQSFVATQQITNAYAAAVRTLLVQQATLDGFARDLRWTGEAFTPPEMLERTVGGANVDVLVLVDSVVTAGTGPVAVPADPYQDLAAGVAYDTVTTTISQEDPHEPLP